MTKAAAPDAKMCPREPLYEMKRAGKDAFLERDQQRSVEFTVSRIWRAMFDAAPAASVAPIEGEVAATHGLPRRTGRISMSAMTKRAVLQGWLERTGMLLESQVVGSGLNAALNDLLRDGVAKMTAHPTVRDRDGTPAAAVVLRASAEREDGIK